MCLDLFTEMHFLLYLNLSIFKYKSEGLQDGKNSK